MPFKHVRVHEATYDKIKQLAEEKGQKISYVVAEAFGVEPEPIAENKFAWMEVGDEMKATHDEADIAELNTLRNRLGRDFSARPNPDYDFWQDDVFADREAWIVRRTK